MVAAPKWQRQLGNLSHTVENTGSEPPLGAILIYDMDGKVQTLANIPVFNKEGLFRVRETHFFIRIFKRHNYWNFSFKLLVLLYLSFILNRTKESFELNERK